MIEKFLPKSLIEWGKAKVNNQIADFHRKHDSHKNKDPFRIPTGYYPFKEESNSYIFRSDEALDEKCENGLPVPPKKLWLGYGNNSHDYLHSGKEQVDKMIEILREKDFDISSACKILELGCGAGRMIRWLYPYSSKCEIIGVDISAEHIFWANRNLNPPLSFATTTIIPHLPFEDQSFDLVFAGSVFTHIDDQVETWLFELSRCMRKEGKFYVTIHDKNTIRHLESNPVFSDCFLAQILKNDENFKRYGSDFEMLVVGRGPDSQVFFEPSYFAKIASSRFRNLGIWEDAYGYQSAVLLEKK
jgi:SAM-dependent methyltransferase